MNKPSGIVQEMLQSQRERWSIADRRREFDTNRGLPDRYVLQFQ